MKSRLMMWMFVALGSLAMGCCSSRCSNKTCRVVPDVKKTTITRFVVDSEDVCLPGCSQPISGGPCPACGELSCRGTCDRCLQPSCGRIITKKKLKKVTETVEKSGYKCVVDDPCIRCESDVVNGGEIVPPVPAK